MHHSLLYTSRKVMPPEAEASEIAKILTVSRSHNAAVDITGGLISTKHAFAQLLEGPVDAIDDLMRRIQCDPRHEGLRVHRRTDISRRKLSFWTLAYCGSWRFVADRVEPLMRGCAEPSAVMIDRLEEAIIHFAKMHRDPHAPEIYG